MSPERAGSPLAIEPRELALALQSAVPPFHMVRLHLHDEEANTDQAAAPSSASVPVTAGLQAPAQVEAPQPEDDDLTSLTWLQDNNLLKGMNLTGVRAELEDDSDKISNVSNKINNNNNVTPTKSSAYNTNFVDQSPTSDYADESSVSEPTDSSSSSLNSPVPYSYSSVKQQKHPQNVKYDPMVHLFSKPPYSFSCLIFMAIEDSPQKALPVKDIYAWILEHFPYFNNAPTGWKNSVRHNLSLNKCFQKVEKSPNLGKGSLWMVEQQYRPNLLQALTRSPFHPCSTLDPATFRSASTRTSSPFVQQAIESTKPSTRLPNPELFPYLSRRLAASEAKNESVKAEPPNTDDDSSLDDVDAATAILALKHGPKVLANVRRRLLKSRGTTTEDATVPVEMVQVITTSPSEDHTYSVADNISSVKADIKNEIKSEADSYLRDDIKRESDVCSSPDEAFESDESNHSQPRYSSSRHFMSMDEDEQRKIEEGADALLNLAGISTLRNDHYTTYSPPEETHHEYSISSKRKRLQQDDSSRSNGHRRAYTERLVSETESFQPRLLRAKRKHTQNKHNVIYSSNNNIVSKKAKILASNEEWVKHKREVINQR